MGKYGNNGSLAAYSGNTGQDTSNSHHLAEKLRAINTYYATPEMHDQAARLLITHILGA